MRLAPLWPCFWCGGEACWHACAGDVQAMLQRETVIWKRGLLVMPQIVRDLLDAMEVGGVPSLHRSSCESSC